MGTGNKSIPFSTITGFKTLRRSFSLRIPSLFVSYISNMRLSQSLSQASFNLKEECYFGISDLDQPAQVKTCQNILQILKKKKMIPSDNLQILYKTERIIIELSTPWGETQTHSNFPVTNIVLVSRVFKQINKALMTLSSCEGILFKFNFILTIESSTETQVAKVDSW